MTMIEPQHFLRLMAWLSPVFPIGGFAYSQGLEQAVADGQITNAEDLSRWLTASMDHGALWQDAVFMALAHQADKTPQALQGLNDLALALISSAERFAETTDQATSFLQAAKPWLDEVPLLPAQPTLPIALGLCAASQTMPLAPTIGAFLHTFVTNQLQVAIRLSLIGQKAATEILAKLEPYIQATSQGASLASLEDIGTIAIGGDIASMRHETLTSRLFIS